MFLIGPVSVFPTGKNQLLSVGVFFDHSLSSLRTYALTGKKLQLPPQTQSIAFSEHGLVKVRAVQ